MTRDDFVRMVLDSLTPAQRVEVLTSPQWDDHEMRGWVINRAIELVEGEVFAETAKNEPRH